MPAFVLFGVQPHDRPELIGVYLSMKDAEQACELHARTPAKFLFGYIIKTRDIGSPAKADWE